MLLRRFLLSACCVLSLPCALSQPAQAQSCSTIKNPVYVAGSTALEPLFKRTRTCWRLIPKIRSRWCI